MARYWVLCAAVCVGVWGGGVAAKAQGAASAAAASPAKAAEHRTCQVDQVPPTPAESALHKKDYVTAEKLFREVLAKSAKSDVVHEELVRTLIEQDKVAEAAKEADTWAAADPANSMAMVAVGDARLRQGDPRAAMMSLVNAVRADGCNARAYYSLAEIDGLAGRHAMAKQMIDQAYALHPTDDDISTWWMSTRPRKQRLAMWAAYAEHSDQINEEDRAKLKTRLEKESQYHASDCRMAPSSPKEAKVPMVAVMDGPTRFVSWGLDVQFNGKRRRLQIDTGASGVMISRAAAMFLGITRDDQTETGGIGDKGRVRTSIAHVASIKIGGVEFTNCPVEILEKWSVLDSDGLIGGDVFARSELTLDFPKHELRIAPLPPRPDEKPEPAALDTAGDDVEPQFHDPYIAPGMEKWMRIYRSGHDLLMPTGIVDTKRVKEEGAWKDKLFLLDTGADTNLISPAAAREVTKVRGDSDLEIHGISGSVNKVYDAGKFTLVFAQLRLDSPAMTAIDTTSISHDAGVEVSGLIGAPALFQLVMHIDYRDNLVMFEYTPKKGW